MRITQMPAPWSIATMRQPVSASSGNSQRSSAHAATNAKFSDDDLAQLLKLKSRDTKVRQHEAAHLATAGNLAMSGASFSYQKGPDGVNYAIGGEVRIDVSPGRTPQETVERAKTIHAAALAPADPSSADLAVAAKAQQMEQQARGEMAQETESLTKSKLKRTYNDQTPTGIGLNILA